MLLLDFLLLNIFFFWRVYCFIEKDLLLNNNGSKLDKYLDNHQENIPSNFESSKYRTNFVFKFFSKSKTSLKYKQICTILLVSVTIFAIKLAFSYNSLNSNFISIKIFSKNFDLVSFLGENIIYFKIYYFILSLYIIIYLVFKGFSCYNNFIKYYDNKKFNEKEKENYIKLGVMDDKKVYIPIDGLYQNLIITGSIGSGKTSSAITNILDGLLKNNFKGLIIDVKGNFYKTVEDIAKKYTMQDRLIKISFDSEYEYNPIFGTNISNFERVNDIKKILREFSNSNESEPFWLDKATSYIQDFLNLIDYSSRPKNFYEIYKMVNKDGYLNELIKEVKENILKNKYLDSELFVLENSINNITNEYLKLDDRTFGIIKAEITRLTNVFVNDYNIYEKFCKGTTEMDFSKNIYVLSLNYGTNKNLTKIIATYLKFDFQRFVLSNNKKNNTFFLADEYQEIANLEDSHFFSLSREYKCVNVVAMQSYSSLKNSLNNENASNVIIQNFVNKIWFRNDDVYTIGQIIKQIGKIQKEIKSISYSQSGQNTKYNAFTKTFKDYKSGMSKTFNYNKKEDYLFNEKYFSLDLKTFEAVCAFSDGNKVKLYERVIFKRWGSDNEN